MLNFLLDISPFGPGSGFKELLDICPDDYAHEIRESVEPADSDARLGRDVLGCHAGGEHIAGMALLIIDPVYDLDQAAFWLH